MIKFLRQNAWFYVPWAALSLLTLAFVLLNQSTVLTLWINNTHTVAFDLLFRTLTWFGTKSFLIFVCVILMFFQFRAAALALTASLLNLGVTTYLKVLFHHDRPATVFHDMPLNFVSGVETSYTLGFPSGHSSSVFCMILSLAIIFNKKILGLFFVSFAALVAFSRIYLLQHFLEDILFGAFVGVMAATIVGYCLYGRRFARNGWLDQSLRTYFPSRLPK